MNTVRLVNASHPLLCDEEHLTCSLVKINEEVLVNKQCATALLSWIEACQGTDEITFVSGWRSFALQQQIMDETIEQRGTDYAHQFVAACRCSEHHTGLAIDLGIKGKDQDLICPDFSGPIAKRMSDTASEFGMILRYPKEKTEITQISEEPWHFRYVGYPHSKIMKEQDFVLEEYYEFLLQWTQDKPYFYSTPQANYQLFTLPKTEKLSLSWQQLRSELDETYDLVVETKEINQCVIPVDRAWIELDVAALRHNFYTTLSLLQPGQQIMAVLKANAYGLGLSHMATLLHQLQVCHYAVATIEEAEVVRLSNPDAEILILGYVPISRLNEISEHHFSITLTSWKQALQIERAGYVIQVHLPVDTGMHRLGEPWNQPEQLLPYFQLKNLKIQALYSHFYEADNLQEQAILSTQKQAERFYQVVSYLQAHGIKPLFTHLQGSYGLLNHNQPSCNLVRTGIALCGNIDEQRSLKGQPFLPVLSIHTRVVAIQHIAQDEGVGYNHYWTSQQPSKIAVLSLGYSDGIARSASFQNVDVLIHGVRCPLIGAMCMDQCCADITHLEDVEIEDEVILIGYQGQQQIDALELAKKTQTIVPETLSALRSRLPRILK